MNLQGCLIHLYRRLFAWLSRGDQTNRLRHFRFFVTNNIRRNGVHMRQYRGILVDYDVGFRAEDDGYIRYG